MRNQLSNGVETRRIANAAAAAFTDVVCTVIDMQGYMGVRAIALLGALTATQTTKLLAEQSDDNGVADAYNQIAVTAQALDADGNKMLILEIAQPTKRYVRFTVDRGVANAVVDGVIAELFRPTIQPVTAHSTVSQQTMVSSPNES